MEKAHEVRITVWFPQELMEELKARRVAYRPSLNSELAQVGREDVTHNKQGVKREKSLQVPTISQ